MVTLGLMPSWKVETSALSQKDHVSTDTANKEAGLLFFFFHFIFCVFTVFSQNQSGISKRRAVGLYLP